MRLEEGRRYRISYLDPVVRRDVPGAVCVAVGTYLGVVEGLSVPSGHAFDLDRDDDAYVLIAPGSLRSIQDVEDVRGGAVAARRPHKPEDEGSSPSPATKETPDVSGGLQQRASRGSLSATLPGA